MSRIVHIEVSPVSHGCFRACCTFRDSETGEYKRVVAIDTGASHAEAVGRLMLHHHPLFGINVISFYPDMPPAKT